MTGVCRACAANTDRVWVGIPGRPGVPLCRGCQEAWEKSGEKRRADTLVRVCDLQKSQSDAAVIVIISGIVSRAMVDFLYRVQKERVTHGREAGA